MKYLVSALEHSANVHLKALHVELKEPTEFVGIFDESLGSPIVDLRSLSIMGFVDALKKLRFFFKLADEMVELAKDVDKVLLIDSSGFNLPLAKKIRKKYPDKEIIYYILPQAWAWKKKRIGVLSSTITHLCSILPFEKEYYPTSAPISYVGHPLLDEITYTKQSLEVSNIITFMPGSRKGEIKKLMPIFLALHKRLNVQAQIVVPSHFSKEDINELYGNISSLKIVHDAHKALYESDFAFICSGTATLEASLIGVPFVLSYKAKALDYFIAKSLIKLNYIGLSNIMFEKLNNRAIHPELIQDDVNVENLEKLYHTMNREQFFEDSKTLREYLKQGSSKTMATILEEKNEH